MGTPAFPTMNKANPKWYENFFHGVALDLWRAAVTEQQTQVEADFIQQQLQVLPGAKVLDVPCGGGRLSLELARRGLELTGLDLAAEFIEEAQERSSQAGLNIEWRQRDMCDLPWEAEFDGAFCFGNSFGYLPDHANEQFVKQVARALKPGARFILDYPAVAECLLSSVEERSWYEMGGITLLIESHYALEQGRSFTEYTFIRDGEVDKRHGSQRIYTFSQMVALLDAAGLKNPQAFSGTNGPEPFKLGAERLFLTAEKV